MNATQIETAIAVLTITMERVELDSDRLAELESHRLDLLEQLWELA